MTEQFANGAVSTLTSSITASTTSIGVASGSLFPSTGNFRVIIGSEIMLCTANSSNTLTVTRAQEGTVATAASSGVQITHILTAGAIEQFRADTIMSGTFASRPSSPPTGTYYRCTDSRYQSIYNGSSWVNFIGDGPQITIPTGMSAAGQTATYVDSSRGPTIIKYLMPNGGYNLSLQVQSLPSVPYQQRCGFRSFWTSAPDQVYFGMVLYNSSSGQIWFFGQADNLPFVTGVLYFSNSTTFGGVNPYNSEDYWTLGQQDKWIIIEDDGTNWNFLYSIDGSYNNAIQVYSMTHNTTFTPNKIGFAVSGHASSSSTVIGEFFDFSLIGS